jgi:hypothetical protein
MLTKGSTIEVSGHSARIVPRKSGTLILAEDFPRKVGLSRDILVNAQEK